MKMHKGHRTDHKQDQPFLFFGGTAYLGLNTHLGFIDLLKTGIDLYGANIGTSRNNNAQVAVYDDAEAYAANRFDMEAAIVMSSGFLAVQMAVRYLASHLYEVLYAPDSHPALWLNGKPNSKRDFTVWAEETVSYINTSTQNDFVVAGNTINSLKPEVYSYAVFDRVSKGKRVHFLLDDSHGIGVMSPNQCAVTCDLPKRSDFKLTIAASMAKGLGIDAGILLSDKETISNLRETPMYMGASPPSPAAMHAFLNAGQIYKDQYRRLQEHIQLCHQHLAVESTYIDHFPVFYFDIPQLYDRLKAEQIVISNFSYPLPTDPPLSRVVINSTHTSDAIVKLCNVLNQMLKHKPSQCEI